MLCACSGEQFKFEEAPQSPESLATRDFSASCLSSRTAGDWDSKLEDIQVDEAESTLKEALSLNYEEARALLGRLEYQRGNFDAALQVFQGIDIRSLAPKMIKAIAEKTRHRKPRARGDIVPPGVMSMHSVSLLLEAILLKSKSLKELGHCRGPQRLAGVQKDLASILLFGAVEAKLPPRLQPWGQGSPSSSIEEAILLLLVLMNKVACGEIKWDEEIMDHLTYALSIIGQFELLAEHVEQALPGVYNRADRWYFLALCYSAAGQKEAALNLLKKVSGFSESKHKPHISSYLLGAKLCSEDSKHAQVGINFARKMINLDNHQSQHFMSEAHKFLGVCYGNAARICLSDSERILLQKECLNSLSLAALNKREDPEVMYNLALENTLQRNLDAAFNSAIMYSETMADNSMEGWKLLSLIVSSQQRFRDAEIVVELALDEAGRMDKFELLRLKAVLQIAQEQPKLAIETYRILLSLIQAQRDLQARNPDHAHIFESEAIAERNLELAVWQDLAAIYTKLGSWSDAKICMDKAKLMDFPSPRSWHTTGVFFEAQSLYKEALVSFSVSLSIEPDYVPSIVSTAEVLMKLGNQSFPIARSFLMNALRLDPTNHQAWFNLGLISKMEGSLQQAADFSKLHMSSSCQLLCKA
ncbi:hypothetical protein GH714_011460 [Hevea brasiliensis]|uniref:Uncharacterized protein n=1 Tax=Hevea brasiliensis TaxID=3981 RepID=A0A6A6NGI9_HEVBR|nr:hypothetical protein GH714_011460 [Hevea brasiliensis]